jgi:hypothetical protein
LRVGVALADFAKLPEGLRAGDLSLGPVLDPLLLLPFVARVASTCGSVLCVEIDGEPVAWATGDRVAVATKTLGSGSVRVVAHRKMGGEQIAPMADTRGVAVSADIWARLDTLALGMTVPASAQSLARAGGEGPDND